MSATMTLEEHKSLLKRYEAVIAELEDIRRAVECGDEWHLTAFSIGFGIPVPSVAAESFVADHIARMKAGAKEMAAALGITPDEALN